MANKKGIAITAAILAAIVGASFLIWFVPQNNPGSLITPQTDFEIISDVYARHNDLADSIESKVGQWRQGNMTSDEILGQIALSRARVQDMQKQIQGASPAKEWQQSFDLYDLALNVFSEYLDAAETLVKSGDTSGSDSDIVDLSAEWRGYVDQSVQAMPIAK